METAEADVGEAMEREAKTTHRGEVKVARVDMVVVVMHLVWVASAAVDMVATVAVSRVFQLLLCGLSPFDHTRSAFYAPTSTEFFRSSSMPLHAELQFGCSIKQFCHYLMLQSPPLWHCGSVIIRNGSVAARVHSDRDTI